MTARKKPRVQSALREFVWRGRTWRIVRVAEADTPGLIGNDARAVIVSEAATVFVRAGLPPDLEIQTLFHEFAHELYPEWKTEPAESSASELGVFERDVPALLSALGVDLLPLVDW